MEAIYENTTSSTRTLERSTRDMYGMSNFDILRWDGLINGTQKSAIGTFIASLFG